MPAVDLIPATVLAVLAAASGRPSRLALAQILDHEILPQDMDEVDVPLLAVYLAEDVPVAEAADGVSNREATVQVQVVDVVASGQTYLSVTTDLRAWVLRSLLPCQEQDTGIEGAELAGQRPYFIKGRKTLGGALLDITIPYLFDPQED